MLATAGFPIAGPDGRTSREQRPDHAARRRPPGRPHCHPGPSRNAFAEDRPWPQCPTADCDDGPFGQSRPVREYGEFMSGDPTADEPTPESQEITAEVVEPDTTQPPSPPPPAEAADTGYTPGGVPTFESVQEKIETRYGTAIGASELAAETPQGRTVEEQYDARQRAAAERLAEIRKSMHPEEGDGQ